jgi:hypothetical protein
MIRQTLTVLGFAVALSACETKVTPTPPSTENTIRFTAAMTAAQEVPPISGPEANGSGTATITFNLTRSAAGNITGGTADFSVTLAGLPAGTQLTAAHIHPGFAGNTGGVSVNTGLAAGEVTLATGAGGFTKNGITLTADQAAGVIANPAGFYFNVHSALNTGGVVRGQLVKQ